MQHPQRNLFRIFLAAFLAFALVACDGATPGPTPNPDPPGDENPRDRTPTAGRVDLSRAIALGLGRDGTPAGGLTAQSSNPVVVAVDDAGQIEELEAEGTTFEDFAIINGRVFLTPSDPWAIGCALVEVIDDTELECVDPYLYSFRELQVGPDGTLYYRGSATDDEWNSVEVLRKRTPEGEVSEVFDLTGPLNVHSWAVASDGLLYLSGGTEGVTETWLRRLNEDGSLTTLASHKSYYGYTPLGVWPDGNLYLVDNGNRNVWQIRPEEDILHPIPYIGTLWEFDEVIHDADELGLHLWNLYSPDSLRTQDGRVMFEYEDDWSELTVQELFPNPQRFEPGLEQIRAGVPRGNDYYFAGRLAPDQYGIVKLDTITGGTETIYETSLEMFTLSVGPDGDKAVFSAFDASKNRYVMAAVDLTTGETTTEPVTTNLTRLEPLH